MAVEDAFPTLTASQLARLRALAEPVDMAVGDNLYSAGDVEPDFLLIESGEVDIIREANAASPARVVAQHGAGRFLGELNLLTGQTCF